MNNQIVSYINLHSNPLFKNGNLGELYVPACFDQASSGGSCRPPRLLPPPVAPAWRIQLLPCTQHPPVAAAVKVACGAAADLMVLKN